MRSRATFADGWLWAGVVLYAGFYFAIGYVRYEGHRNFVDLGIFAQTAASAFGCFCNTIEGSHWAYHFSPILYLAGALMRLWPSALALIALQAVAGALTAPPIYALLLRHTGDRALARMGALVVFVYAPLGGVIFNDFHENGLAPAAIAWLLWAFDGGSVALTALFALIALSVKEDQAIFIAVAGGLAAWRLRGTTRSPMALGIAVLAAAVALKFFLEIQPHAAASAHWNPVRFYHWTAADVRALLPAGILERLGFLLLAFAPLLFIPWRTRAAWLMVLPLAEVLLSRDSTTFTMGSHYAGAWAGWMFYAFACAVRGVYARNPHRARAILAWCAALCIVEFAVADPLHPGYFLHGPTQRDRALNVFLRRLPAHARIATQEEAYTHLAASDPNATLLPERKDEPIDACMILTDGAFPDSPRLVESGAHVKQLVARGVYRLARTEGAITLYVRPGCAQQAR